ncbi:hypothetical protein NMY22_g6205 [Coprinellus aureogranulatus]|nr:hypothetical protein NMY22_g6205 [Coprinellus aureogranulatus]
MVFTTYTAHTSPVIHRIQGGKDPAAMTWSAAALEGATATIMIILTTLAEFSYIPTTRNNASPLTRRLLFLLVITPPPVLTGGLMIYIAVVGSHDDGGNMALILGIVQFLSVVAYSLSYRQR